MVYRSAGKKMAVYYLPCEPCQADTGFKISVGVIPKHKKEACRKIYCFVEINCQCIFLVEHIFKSYFRSLP